MPLDSAQNREIVFVPHPGPQEAFVNCPVQEVVYGGARGGGKTFACLGEFILHSQNYGPHAKGIFLRRTREALKDAIREARVLFRELAEWKSSRNEFHFNNGAVLIFNYLDRDDDADNYQGHQYTRVYIEELTQFPDPAPIKKMFATLRSAYGVPCQFRATCNPGGAGHSWVKERYVDLGAYHVFTDERSESQRVYIPAKIRDNPTLLKNDPDYIKRLRMSGSDQLVKAWLDGDWSVIDGAFFPEWDTEKHVLPHLPVMERINEGDVRCFMAGDWGSASPFSFGWYAIIPDAFIVDGRKIPRGALIRYREYYGCRRGDINKGLKMPAEAVAAQIADKSNEQLLYGVLDPSAFASDGGPSIAERMASQGARFRRADNKRVARKGSIGGWDMVRYRLSGASESGGMPMLYATDRSFHLMRTLPVIQHDKNNVEDLDTEAEDHALDELRYACMSRPWIPRRKPKKKQKDPYSASVFWRDVGAEPERQKL